MAGHSKYANIKHRKNAQDAKRAKKFNKIAREISVAVRIGASDDPEFNPRLRTAISAAKSENMPNDRIDRAIKAGLGGNGNEENYEEMRYEGYGPGGIAIIVEALTDNKNRAASEVRTAFAKHGGSMGETGSVSYMFDHVGRIVFDEEAISEDDIFEKAVDAGAENVRTQNNKHTVITALGDFTNILDALEKDIGQPRSSGLYWLPQAPVETPEDNLVSLAKMIGVLDDLDDVQYVYHNCDIDDELLEGYGG